MTAKTSEEKLRLLLETGEILTTSLEYKVVARHVVEVAVPRLALAVVLDMLSGEQYHAAAPAYDFDLKNLYQSYFQLMAQRAMQSGETLIDSYPLPGTEDQQNVCFVPLIVQGECLGVLILIGVQEGMDDMVDGFAQQAALVLHHARLHGDVRRKNIHEERAEILQRVALAFSQAMSPQEVARIVYEQGLRTLNIHSLYIGIVDAAHDSIEMISGFNISRVTQQHYGALRVPLHDGNSMAEAIRQKQPVWHKNIADHVEAYPLYKDMLANGSVRAVASLPLKVNDTIFGGISIGFNEPRQFEQDERDFLIGLVQQCAQAMERIRLYKEAKTAQEWFEVTLSSIGDAVIAVDLHGNVTFINGIAEELTGWPRQEALGQPLQKVFNIQHEITGEAAENPFAQVMATGENAGLPNLTVLLRRDGISIPIADSGAPIRDSDGQVMGMVLTFRDIRYQREAERLLQASEARYRMMTENAQDIIYRYRVQPTPGYEYVSASAASITGYTPEEYYNDPAIDLKLVHPDDQPAFAEVLQSKGSTGLTVILRSIRKDGTLIWMEHRFNLNLDSKGNLLYVDGIARDVTERYQAEVILRNSEARLRTILENMPVILTARDHEGYTVAWNKEAERVTGYPAAEVLYNPDFAEKIYPDPSYRNNVMGQFGSVKGNYRNWEVSLKTRDGSFRTIAWSSISSEFPVPGWDSWTIGLDVTERKEAEGRALVLQLIAAALSEAITPEQVAEVVASKAALALHSSFATVVALDETGNYVEMLNYIGIHPQILRQFQRTPITFPAPIVECIRTGQSIWIRNKAEYIERYPSVLPALNITGSESTACLPLIVNKAVIGAMMISFPESRRWEMDERRFIETLGDYCAQALERARLYSQEHAARTRAEDAHEVEVLARQDAEKANQIKMQFLAMISHELRTPLTSIKGFTSTLLADDVTFDLPSQRRFLQIIDLESDRLIDLIGHLIDLSHLQAGTLSIELRSQDFANILANTLPTLRMLAPANPIVTNLDAGLPMIRGDSQRIAQVLINLVANAVRYSPKYTSIQINAAPQGDFMQIDVVDEGKGIPPEDRTVVFEAFRQLDRNSQAGGQSGAGLGLAICKGIIERHGGKIWIQDNPLPGTTVSFTLPLAGK